LIPVRPLESFAIDRESVVEGTTFDACRAIVDDVRRRGDAAVREFARRFDRSDRADFEVTPGEWESATVPAELLAAIRSVYERIAEFHRRGLVRDFEYSPEPGVVVGTRVVPFERAGIYVPGGLAVYPSSLCMAAAAANVAGVPEVILCTPPDARGAVPEVMLATARICGIARAFGVGGAQAIGAMAYGTETVPACEIVVGPGNRYVTAAKKAVAGDVAIDFLAGPTEILVLSDGTVDPSFVAADLVAQSEHDAAACALLVTTSADHAEAVNRELERQTLAAPRSSIIQAALRTHGAILVAKDLESAVAFVNRFAPEHLVLATGGPRDLLPRIRHAGAVFLGAYAPVAIGDYGSGPNAILPTLGEARRRSGLTANAFLKTITYEELTEAGLRTLAPAALALASAEGLPAHRRSIEIRHER